MIAAAATVSALAGGLVGLGGATPASAQEAPPYPDPVAGNFTGDARDEVFSYWAGPSPDTLVSFAKGGGTVTMTKYQFTVNGFHRPIAGNFDGDAFDEIIWYGAGANPDYLWNFTSTTTASSQAISVSGSYQPVAGDFTGDGTDDVFWYGPGADPDDLWDFVATGAYTSSGQTVGGIYVPVAGSFGVDDTDTGGSRTAPSGGAQRGRGRRGPGGTGGGRDLRPWPATRRGGILGGSTRTWRCTMDARVGDRIIIRGHRVGEPDRDAEVVEVRGPAGGPPYVVRWENGHETLFFPGSDAVVEHVGGGTQGRPRR